jgi:hypothetical protein
MSRGRMRSRSHPVGEGLQWKFRWWSGDQPLDDVVGVLLERRPDDLQSGEVGELWRAPLSGCVRPKVARERNAPSASGTVSCRRGFRNPSWPGNGTKAISAPSPVLANKVSKPQNGFRLRTLLHESLLRVDARPGSERTKAGDLRSPALAVTSTSVSSGSLPPIKSGRSAMALANRARCRRRADSAGWRLRRC